MEFIETIFLALASMPFLYFGLFLFACIWWYSCKWLFVGLVIIGEKFFKKDSLPYNIYMFTFVGGGGLASIYFFIWLLVFIAKENGY